MKLYTEKIYIRSTVVFFFTYKNYQKLFSKDNLFLITLKKDLFFCCCFIPNDYFFSFKYIVQQTFRNSLVSHQHWDNLCIHSSVKHCSLFAFCFVKCFHEIKFFSLQDFWFASSFTRTKLQISIIVCPHTMSFLKI